MYLLYLNCSKETFDKIFYAGFNTLHISSGKVSVLSYKNAFTMSAHERTFTEAPTFPTKQMKRSFINTMKNCFISQAILMTRFNRQLRFMVFWVNNQSQITT